MEKALNKRPIADTLKKLFLDPANFRLLFFVVMYCDIRYLSPVIYESVILVMTLWSAVLMVNQLAVRKRMMRVKFRRIIFIFMFFALVSVLLHSEINLWRNLLTLWWIGVCLFLFYGVHSEKSNLRVRKEAKRLFDVLTFMTNATMIIGLVLFMIFPKGFSLFGFDFCIIEGRFVGIIPNANVTAFYSVITIVFCTILLRMRRADGTITKKLRIWYISGIILNSIVLILTDSNASMVFIMVYVCFLFFYELFKEFSLMKLHTVLFRIAATVLACVVAVAAILFIRVNVQNGASAVLTQRDSQIVVDTKLDANDKVNLNKADLSPKPSNTKKIIGHQNTNIDSGRFVLWRQALGLIELHPLFGIGKENIPEYGVEYLGGIRYTNLGGHKYVDFHNGLLTITVSFGIVGLSLFLVFAITIAKAILKSMFRHKLRSRRDGNVLVIIAAFSAAYCVYSMFEAALFIDYTYRVLIFWYIIGLGLSYVMKYHQQGLHAKIDPVPINDDSSEFEYIKRKFNFIRNKFGRSKDKPEPKDEPEPEEDKPESKDEPEPEEDKPDSKDEPEPEEDKPESKDEPEPEEDKPEPKDEPEPEEDKPDSKDEPEPEEDKPDSKDKSEPEGDKSDSKDKPEPEEGKPDSKDKPEPEEDKPEPKDEPEPEEDKPESKDEPEPEENKSESKDESEPQEDKAEKIKE